MHHRSVNPRICPPEYIVRDRFIPREAPYIHPVVHVNRHHIVDVPRHSVRHFRRDEFYEQSNNNRTRRFW